MFGFGISEIIIIVIVALVLINPRDFPIIVRKLGKMYGTVMRQINGMRKTYGHFEEEVKYLSDLNVKDKRNHGDKK